MDICNTRALRSAADRSLAVGREPKKVIGAYVGALALLSLAVMVIDLILDRQLDQAVGLSNLELNALLSTFQLILPVLQMLAVLCLNLGYQAALQRIARGQYADHTDLKTGLDRFWALLRMTALQFALYFALCFALVYPCMIIFMLSPFSGDFIAIYNTVTVVDETVMEQLYTALEPMMLVFSVVYFIVCTPIYFRFRLANYILLDKPREGALAALRGSARLMRGNRMHLFKADLRLWWYYLIVAVLTVVSYGNLLLPALGVVLPWSATVSYYVFYALYTAGTLVADYLLRNRVEMTYVQFYEAIRPREQPQQGVVLGNIFQM